MKIQSLPLNTTNRHVDHLIETTKPGFFVKVSTYHFQGKYVRTVKVVELNDDCERWIMGLSSNGRDIYRVIEKTPRYSAKRLAEIAGYDETEIQSVAAANELTLA